MADQTAPVPGENGREARPDSGSGAAPREEAAPEPGERVADLEAQLVELEDRWRRALADFDNLRKRLAREAQQQRADERERVLREWLPVIDNLDLALEHAGTDPNAIVEGVRAVRDQALGILSRLGFPRRSDVGEAFDPGRHEAVAAVPDPQAPAGTVLHVVRPGYGDDERQLRPAAVVVATRGE